MPSRLRTRLRAGANLAVPTLNLEFATAAGGLDSRVTFTRSTTATRVNASGLIESVAINGPRFDYDPVTLAPKGLLIEEQRTNLVTYSEQFDNAYWAKTGATVSANTTTSPDGTLNADTLVEDTSTGTHRVFATPACSASTVYAFTAYVKEAGRTQVRMTETTLGGAYFDLSAGTVVSFDAGVTASIQNAGNGWYRCRILATTGASQTLYVAQIQGASAGKNSYTGNGAAALHLYGAQLEAGAFATSYIPTVASQVTRTADVATMTGTNFSSWYNANAGTIVANADTIATTGTRSIMAPSTGGNFLLYISNFNYAGEYDGTNLTLTANQTTQNTAFKAASSYGSGGMSVVLNNGTVATGSYNNAFAPIVAVFLGTNAASGALNGHIRSIQYYPTRLTNQQLQALTA